MGHCWTLALEQQTDLTPSHGSVSGLAAAVRRGADLRLYMTTDLYEETLYFQQTYAGEDGAFAGLMSHHHSYVHRGKDIEQPYISIFKYDESGSFSHVKWMPGDVRLDESQAYPYGIYRWFVCDRWRTVYEHDADGDPVRGESGGTERACPAGALRSGWSPATVRFWPWMPLTGHRTSLLLRQCSRSSAMAMCSPTATSLR